MNSLESILDAEFLGEVLTHLETEETGALTWGAVEVAWERPEILDKIRGFTSDNPTGRLQPDEVLDALLDRGLVIRLDTNSGQVFRTRMAETVRLAAQLRQIFDGRGDSGWRSARSLVDDFRFVARRRRFPRRDIAATDIFDGLAESGFNGGTLRIAVDAMVQGRELSGFQVRAARSIFGSLVRRDRSSGTVITAGTGSGKTLAFYLPLLSFLASTYPGGGWTKALSIYPRNELLKDQLTEAIGQLSKLRSAGIRSLSVGAYFGKAPHSSDDRNAKWEQRGSSSVCPLFRCPECSGDMLWRDKDRSAGREQLACNDCGFSTDESWVRITRRSQQERPPDLLFTTVEMLNQRLSDPKLWPLLGVSRERQPIDVLLDEVHTFSGFYGAQAALLIRRYLAATRWQPVVVGLSATLEAPEAFFEQLTGIQGHRIAHVAPGGAELEEGGLEYRLALRSDPRSGVSPLSTTIQTAMLMRRMLDRELYNPSKGTFGSRVFVFTDDLDVTNRLFDDLRHAEGFDWGGRPHAPRDRPHGSLANLRSPALPDRSERLAQGQSWDAADRIGHDLTPGVRERVGRTSSQDSGVDDSQIIVATASLEVGFDDPSVGAVIQHKAPRDPAQFIQRLGRAGRSREMRPWGIVVLSDFGRDRGAFSAYDRLFSPTLEARSLPIGNRYVLRSQAVAALLDWAAGRVPGSAWMWRVAAGDDASKREQLADFLESILLEDGTRTDLRLHLKRALGIDDWQVDQVLWSPPRSLILEAIPTLQRRLSTSWRTSRADANDFKTPHHPLPDFMPQALFESLAVPDVRVDLGDDHLEDPEYLPVAMALSEFAPGRVTRRYGARWGGLRHWVPPPTEGSAVDIDDWFPGAESIGRSALGSGVSVDVFQPQEVRPTRHVPTAVANSSNAFLNWQTALVVEEQGELMSFPSLPGISELIEECRVHTHGGDGPIRVTRLAADVKIDVAMTTGERRRGRVGFHRVGAPAALGFTQFVDGVRFRFRFPDRVDLSPQALRSLRSSWFADAARASDVLDDSLGPIDIDWLVTASILVMARRKAEGFPPELKDDEVQALLRAAVGSLVAPDSGESNVLSERLSGHVENLEVVAEFRRLADLPGSAGDPRWRGWLERRLAVTVGEAVQAVAIGMVPAASFDSLMMDVVVDAAGFDVWITEPDPGGIGSVEEFRAGLAADPRKFLRLVHSTIGRSEAEATEAAIEEVLAAGQSSDQVAVDLAVLRGTPSPGAATAAVGRLVAEFRGRGAPVRRSAWTTLLLRVLRPGTSNASDAGLLELLVEWRELEECIGFEVEDRVFATLAVDDGRLREMFAVHGADPRRFASNLLSVLPLRGYRARAALLGSFNRFDPNRLTDRLLAADLLPPQRLPIDTASPDWRRRLADELAEHGEARIIGPNDAVALGGHLLACLVQSIDVGFLQFFPRVVALEASDGGLVATLDLEEAPR